MLDDADQAHRRIRAVHGLFRALETRRVDSVGQLNQGLELGLGKAELARAGIEDQFRARAVAGIEEELRVASIFEGAPIVVGLKGRAVMIEVPSELGRRAEAI